MKTICVFGAGGRTGKLVVEEALRRGHKVHAFVYKNRHNLPEEALIFEGDAQDQHKVLEAIAGCDAVISVLGHSVTTNRLMQTKSIQNIVNAMKKSGIMRVVSLTGTGVRIHRDRPSILDYLVNMFVYLFSPIRVNDGIEHAKVLQNSDLDWTILRVLKLSNSKAEPKRILLTSGGPAEFPTSRKKVARIMVSLVETNDFVHQMPVSS